MFPTLLAIHSLLRWLILLSIVYSIFLAFRGWLKNRRFTNYDNWIRIITVSFVHIQLIIGIWLYFISPIVAYFLKNFSESLHQTQLRFFGMEHITMMLIGISLVTIGSSIARRKKNDKEKFKAIAIWYSIAFVVIFTSIPWAFSPFTARPYFRMF
jgi:uncharacterized membrane protein